VARNSLSCCAWSAREGTCRDGILLLVIRCLCYFLAAIAFACSAAYAQTVHEVAKSLEGHNFVLRNYYTDDSLTFDSTGKLTSHGTPGFGPTDGLVHIEKVEIMPTAISLVGERPVYFWDSVQSDFKLMNVGDVVKISLELPSGQTEADNSFDLLKQVFFAQAELQNSKCTDTDRKLKGFTKPAASNAAEAAPDITNRLKAICFPGGERASPVSKGIIDPPKVIYDPDPALPKVRRNDPQEPTVRLALIVNASGSPTTIVVTGPIGYGYDEETLGAVRRWKFKPATQDGKPVPVAINIEMNFRR
jgi:TonB family protein